MHQNTILLNMFLVENYKFVVFLHKRKLSLATERKRNLFSMYTQEYVTKLFDEDQFLDSYSLKCF